MGTSSSALEMAAEHDVLIGPDGGRYFCPLSLREPQTGAGLFILATIAVVVYQTLAFIVTTLINHPRLFVPSTETVRSTLVWGVLFAYPLFCWIAVWMLPELLARKGPLLTLIGGFFGFLILSAAIGTKFDAILRASQRTQ
jgi:hypothetical protein